MKNLENTIQEFYDLRIQLNLAQFGDYDNNRILFNRLKNLLIENGFDLEIITIDHRENFFIPPDDYKKKYHNPMEDFKDDKGKLVALCTKAIRDLRLKLESNKSKSPNLNQAKTLIKTEKVYPHTSWKLIRNALFWTIFGLILTLSCAAFYYIGQNSKEKENADLVVANGEKNAEIKELKNELQKKSLEFEKCRSENVRLNELLK